MRPIHWMGETLDDLSAFPGDVKRSFGYDLREVQKGNTPRDAKPLRQFGCGVFELREAFEGDAFRAVYAVKLKRAVYVLHVFKKKSKVGIAMPRTDIALIERRLGRAHEIDAAAAGA